MNSAQASLPSKSLPSALRLDESGPLWALEGRVHHCQADSGIAGGDITWTYKAPADGWYFFVVDGGASGYSEHKGYYDIKFTLTGCSNASCSCP